MGGRTSAPLPSSGVPSDVSGGNACVPLFRSVRQRAVPPSIRASVAAMVPKRSQTAKPPAGACGLTRPTFHTDPVLNATERPGLPSAQWDADRGYGYVVVQTECWLQSQPRLPGPPPTGQCSGKRWLSASPSAVGLEGTALRNRPANSRTLRVPAPSRKTRSVLRTTASPSSRERGGFREVHSVHPDYPTLT